MDDYTNKYKGEQVEVALFGDRRGHAYAVDAGTGKTLWKVKPDDAPSVQVTGAPALFEGHLPGDAHRGEDGSWVRRRGPAATRPTFGEAPWRGDPYDLAELMSQAPRVASARMRVVDDATSP